MIDNDNIKRIFGSNTRIKLFDLFLNNPTRKYYVREITRLIDEQINSVRRELNNLNQIGIIEKTEQDRKMYYQVNQGFEHYIPLAAIFSNQEISIEENLKRKWQPYIEQVKDYLDFVYVANDKNCSLDILIIGDNSDNILSKWSAKVEKDFARELKYSIMNLKDYQYRLAIKDKFLADFLNQDVELIYSKT